MRALVAGSGESQIAIWGDEGKTHLINATAYQARELGLQSQLYDAEQLQHLDAEAFDGWQQADLLAVDNLDAIAGNLGWEKQFYQVMNAVREGDMKFVFSLSTKPASLPTALADFQSRLLWGLQFQLESATDDLLLEILQVKARDMGMTVKDEVLRYQLTHVSRRLKDQVSILQQLERVTLVEKRRASIPLLKEVIASQD